MQRVGGTQRFRSQSLDRICPIKVKNLKNKTLYYLMIDVLINGILPLEGHDRGISY